MKAGTNFALRLATEKDIPALHALIEASVRGLQTADYTQSQIDGALGTVLGLDTLLIRDGTYFVAEEVAGDEERDQGTEARGRVAGGGGRGRGSPPRTAQHRCEPSLYIRGLQDGDWEPSSWRKLKQRLERRRSVDMRRA